MDDMETTPGVVADMIRKAVEAEGGEVTYNNANGQGRFGFMVLRMPDNTEVTLKIELN
jgi:hypothetical protein